MEPIELMEKARIAVAMAGMSWFVSFIALGIGGDDEEDNSGTRKIGCAFLIIAIICLIVMIRFIIAAKIAERAFWGNY